MSDRLLSKVLFGDGCWNWMAAVTTGGYGRYAVGSRSDNSRRTVLAHRTMYERFVGPIPEGLVIDHLCRNRRCVRPDHLEVVDQQTNIRRGETAKAQRDKTHCPAGHEYNAQNTYYHGGADGRSWRRCRVCNLAFYHLRKVG